MRLIGSRLQNHLVNINGAFTVAQEASKRMIPAKQGLFFSLGPRQVSKGFRDHLFLLWESSCKRIGTESLYRELSPLGIHVAHLLLINRRERSSTFMIPKN